MTQPDLDADTTDTTLTCRHFVTYSGVKLPLKLVNPLDTDAIQNRNTYFRAYFDTTDRLLAVQKLVYGEVELDHRYGYHPNGQLAVAQVTDEDGEVVALRFDESGNPLNS